MMLSVVALSAISGLLTVLIESWWARRNTIIAQYSVGFAYSSNLSRSSGCLWKEIRILHWHVFCDGQ
jgi:hypothetical protein